MKSLETMSFEQQKKKMEMFSLKKKRHRKDMVDLSSVKINAFIQFSLNKHLWSTFCVPGEGHHRQKRGELVVGEPGEKVFRGDRMVWLGSASLQFCGQKRLFALLFRNSVSFRSFVTAFFFSFSKTDNYARVGDAW